MGTSINFVELETPTSYDLSIILPVFNEAEAFPTFIKEVITELESQSNISVQLVVVDDGSTDKTSAELAKIQFSDLVVVKHLVNLGHQQAIITGLHLSKGRYIGMMDTDGQHPISDLFAMYEIAVKNRLDLVQGLRKSRKTDSILKKTTAGIFYRLMKALTNVDFLKDAADFRILSNSCKNALLSIPKPLPLRFSVHSLNVPKSVYYFEVTPRLGGTSKYTVRKMLSLALSSITNFSELPLRFIFWMGIFTSSMSFMLLLFTVTSSILGKTIAGWASLATLISFLGAIILLCLGVIAIYMATLIDKDSSVISTVHVIELGNEK